MKGQSFSLQPFPSQGRLPAVKIIGSVARRVNVLALDYELLGPLTDLLIPGPAHRPSRRNGLWEETCFEFFIAMKNSLRYWEFNFSPAGHWNVYRFADYRQGMQPEMAVDTVALHIRMDAELYTLSLEFDLNLIFPLNQVLEVAVSAVLKQQSGERSYWALDHRGTHPDFHRRDGFIVVL